MISLRHTHSNEFEVMGVHFRSIGYFAEMVKGASVDSQGVAQHQERGEGGDTKEVAPSMHRGPANMDFPELGFVFLSCLSGLVGVVVKIENEDRLRKIRY